VERFTAISRLNGTKVVNSASTGSLVARISPPLPSVDAEFKWQFGHPHEVFELFTVTSVTGANGATRSMIYDPFNRPWTLRRWMGR
jgi:hypothetical protein